MGRLRRVTAVCQRDLDQHAGVVQVGVADLDPKIQVRASPAARAHQDKALPLQCLVEASDHPGDLHLGGGVLDLIIDRRIHPDDVAHIRHDALGGQSIRREKPVLIRHIVGDSDRPAFLPETERSTLQQRDLYSRAAAVAQLLDSELDIYRTLIVAFHGLEQKLDQGHKVGPGDQVVKC